MSSISFPSRVTSHTTVTRAELMPGGERDMYVSAPNSRRPNLGSINADRYENLRILKTFFEIHEICINNFKEKTVC